MLRVVERSGPRRVGRAVVQGNMWIPNVDVSAASLLEEKQANQLI